MAMWYGKENAYSMELGCVVCCMNDYKLFMEKKFSFTLKYKMKG